MTIGELVTGLDGLDYSLQCLESTIQTLKSEADETRQRLAQVKEALMPITAPPPGLPSANGIPPKGVGS